MYNIHMKIATYNIHGWRTTDGRPNLEMLINVLQNIDADIIGLNEVFYPRMVAGADSPALEALAQRLNMHFVFGPCLRWPTQDDLPADAYGNALLSRWPIIASAAHHLTPKEEDQQNLLAEKEQRGLLEARILLPNQHTFTVYVTHLDHTGEEVRQIQLRVLRSWTGRDRNRPHVVMGDFNAVSPWDFADRSAEYAGLTRHAAGPALTTNKQGPQIIPQMENTGYVDCFRLFGSPGAHSFIPAEQPIRIDYIWASQPLAQAVKSCQIWMEPPNAEASDHRPIVAEINWE